ncbi:DUF3168 domain-containing protein [Falsirhodobacter sp. 20TX0035]|uniref:DUF3168 domain-containing protein n=1 Tax=Falsirhodobacter sp. 20TX0035 TaxID=3022019 RepID=UPI002330C463|nr:DUF3168 domain-containing protein [Falsirhodobacter sp. 20TX0035]MDB6453237.1 DUF3168 domain-containing protein [Falsirhodobacter sp. 20TX0035]
MSYTTAAALQAAIHGRLTAALDVPVLDAAPDGEPGTWVLIGPEDVRDRSDKSGAGAEHRLVLTVRSDAEGFLRAKGVAGAICDALAAPMQMTRGRIAALWFDRAVARREDAGRTRRIDLTFRARVEDSTGEA